MSDPSILAGLTVAEANALKPVYSMTGYADMKVQSEDHGDIVLTIMAVNHRFLDLQMRVPNSFGTLEPEIRKRLKNQIHRGHIDFTLQLQRSVQAEIVLQDHLLSAYLDAFRAAAEKYGLAYEPDLNEIIRLPGVMSSHAAASFSPSERSSEALLEAVSDLISKFNKTRATEGEALATELRNSMKRLEQLADEANALRGGVRAASFDRLRSRLQELTEGLAISDDRLIAEAALLAERSDIKEELVRLRTHANSFAAILAEGGPVGKQLDFLLQELNRESNTLLSKTGGASSLNGLRITELGLEMKMVIERAREQIQNLE